MASYIELQKAFFGLLGNVLPTLLWVSLAVWIILRFRTEVARVVNAIAGRIEKGADVTALGVSLKEVRPIPLDEQKRAVDDAVREEVQMRQDDPRAGGPPLADPAKASWPPSQDPYVLKNGSSIRRDIFDSEMLGLRYVNLQLGLPYAPSAEVNNIKVDGVFVTSAGIEAVAQVRFMRSPVTATRFGAQLRELSERITHDRPGERQIKVIGMVVVNNEHMITEATKRIAAAAERPGGEPAFSFYVKSLQSLREEFGAEAKE